jgi:hypothetical protein
MFQEIERLAQSVKTHPALNNAFYYSWQSERLTLSQIGVFAINYREFTFRFPEALASLILNINDLTARAEYTKTLYSEMGNGNPNVAHSVLFEKFCNDLSAHSGNPGFLKIDNLKKSHPILEETICLVQGEKMLYTKSHAIATGAQLAQEFSVNNFCHPFNPDLSLIIG